MAFLQIFAGLYRKNLNTYRIRRLGTSSLQILNNKMIIAVPGKIAQAQIIRNIKSLVVAVLLVIIFSERVDY